MSGVLLSEDSTKLVLKITELVRSFPGVAAHMDFIHRLDCCALCPEYVQSGLSWSCAGPQSEHVALPWESYY